jgi:hypothetical protein
MIYPHDFGFNQQTGIDNTFQHQPPREQVTEIRVKAINEFTKMVHQLEKFHIEVLVLDTKTNNQTLPDAIFPNNWFSTRADGTLFIYPMKTPNRQSEVQVEPLSNKFSDNGYQINNIIDLREELGSSNILEGTGSIIFHHPSSNVFAAYSERCLPAALDTFCCNYGYNRFAFNSKTNQGNSIYHTNVLMSCGLDFAVIADETLTKVNDRSKILNALSCTVNDLILISEQQMSENFCANIIQLTDKNNQNCIILSTSAYKGFMPNQIKQLEKHGSLVICDIPTIEFVGGSARCMIAENFLPRSGGF